MTGGGGVPGPGVEPAAGVGRHVPGTLAVLSGATVLANLSASNVTVGKWEDRQQLVTGSAAKNLAVQLYSAAGFGESTADLAWDGHGLIAERGELVAETRLTGPKTTRLPTFSTSEYATSGSLGSSARRGIVMSTTPSWSTSASSMPICVFGPPSAREPLNSHGLARVIS